MKSARLKDLKRPQLEKLLRANEPHVGFNKRTSVKNLRKKFNMLGGEYSWITYDKDYKIINR